MIKRLMVVAVFAVSASACAPVMQSPVSSRAPCASAATVDVECAPATAVRADVQTQEPQEPKKSPPPGPGKKDFGTWMLLLTMGFSALYLMAFK